MVAKVCEDAREGAKSGRGRERLSEYLQIGMRGNPSDRIHGPTQKCLAQRVGARSVAENGLA